MDGTLIDSSNVIYNTINYVRENLGLDKLNKEILLANLNNPNIDSKFFYGSEEFTDEQTKLFNEYYEKNCISDIKLYDGIKEFLEDIRKEFQTISIATNASTKFAKKMLNFLEIEKYFDIIIGADMVNKPKPAPDMLIKIIDILNINPKETVLIGDSEKDFISANKINIDFIFVEWGFNKIPLNTIRASSVKELKNILYLF